MQENSFQGAKADIGSQPHLSMASSLLRSVQGQGVGGAEEYLILFKKDIGVLIF